MQEKGVEEMEKEKWEGHAISVYWCVQMKATIVPQKAEIEPLYLPLTYCMIMCSQICVCVLQICEWQQGWYSTNLAAAASGLEKHSTGHADQITRVCVYGCQSLGFSASTVVLRAESCRLASSCRLSCQSKYSKNQSRCIKNPRPVV